MEHRQDLRVPSDGSVKLKQKPPMMELLLVLLLPTTMQRAKEKTEEREMPEVNKATYLATSRRPPKQKPTTKPRH